MSPTPSRTLWVLRHAKADREPPSGGADRDRPLAPRGRRDAAALGRRLAADPVDLAGCDVPPPETVVCSAAVRTRQTADLVAAAFGGRRSVDAFRSLYGAGTDVVLRYVREVDEAVGSLLVVGHNPTVFQLTWELLDDAGDREALEAHGVPTCAVAAISLGVSSWEDVAFRCGRLAGLWKPPY